MLVEIVQLISRSTKLQRSDMSVEKRYVKETTKKLAPEERHVSRKKYGPLAKAKLQRSEMLVGSKKKYKTPLKASSIGATCYTIGSQF